MIKRTCLRFVQGKELGQVQELMCEVLKMLLAKFENNGKAANTAVLINLALVNFFVALRIEPAAIV
jgi:hypothetical protein